MKTTESICPQDHFIRCANCSRWIKAGSPVVTTVLPGIVTQAHAECPIRADGSRLAADLVSIIRNRKDA